MLAVPNLSEGRDGDLIVRLAAGFDPLRLLDVHSDPDHHRSVFTLAGGQGEIARGLASGAKRAAELIDLARHDGSHPRVGALDVAPVVYLDDADRGAAIAEALLAADAIGAAGIPVYLYGELADGRTRAELRKGGPEGLAARGTA